VFLPPTITPGSCDLGINLENSSNRTNHQKTQALYKYTNHNKQIHFKNIIRIWTDGSVLDNNNCSCSIIISFNNKELTIQYKIQGNITFGETTAICIALLCTNLLNLQLPIYLFTDSQNSYNNIFNKISPKTHNPTILNYIKKQFIFHNFNLIKIPSHCNIIGNDIADNLANSGHQLINTLNANSLIELKQAFENHIKNFINNINLKTNCSLINKHYPSTSFPPTSNFTDYNLVSPFPFLLLVTITSRVVIYDLL